MIIGINGDIGAGKDTLGMILQALTMGRRYTNEPLEYLKGYEGRPNLKGGWPIKKFADKLKEFAAKSLGVTRDYVETREFKEAVLGPEWGRRTGRRFMQDLGEQLRHMEPNYWVNALFVDYKPLPPPYYSRSLTDTQIPYPSWIITDMRHPNEFEDIKSLGGTTVEIIRPDNPYQGSEHASEGGLKGFPFDLTVQNTSLEAVVQQAKALLWAVDTNATLRWT